MISNVNINGKLVKNVVVISNNASPRKVNKNYTFFPVEKLIPYCGTSPVF